ncbi:MAG: hypothetical protein DRP11_03150, partial [Candidatus Aenigmatarchaeota archaeon]
LYVFNHTGSSLQVESTYGTGWTFSSPSIADVDNDGILEIAIGSSGSGRVYVFHHTGTSLQLEASYTTGDRVWSSPTIADVDNDGILEIIVGSADNKLYVFNHTDSTLQIESTYTTEGEIWSSPSVDDVNNDGILEIVVGSRNNNTYVFSAGPYENYPWQTWTTFHHDLNRTGVQQNIGTRNTLTCSLQSSQTCSLTWTINTTGTAGTIWLIDTNASSSYSHIQQNETDDSYIQIIESTPPQIQIQLPENTTYNYNTNLPLNYTATDQYLDQCWYSLDSGTNISLPNCQNTTFSTTEGTHYITVYANDTSQNENSSTVYFTIDTTNPQIQFVPPTPEDNNITTNNWAYINVSTSDSSNTTSFIDWNRSLVLWMRFNNESGENSTFFRDWSSYGNNGTCSGTSCPTQVYGKFGKALEFDGVDDYVDCGNNSSLNIINELTIETWIKQNTMTGPTFRYIIGRGTNYVNESYLMQYDPSNNYWRFGIYDGTNFYEAVTEANQNIWKHLVGVFNGTSVKIYVNGIKKYETTFSATHIIVDPDKHVFVGGHTSGRYFNGTIDEVRIWNRALSPEEINASYHAGLYRLYHNFTNLTDGTYTYKAYVQDLAGNLNETEERTITIGNVKYIDSCQDLTAPNTIYYLTTNVSSAGTCFNILANNITLDCQDYWIRYSQSTVGYAINITGYNSTTIKNCNIIQDSFSADSYGIYLSENSNSNTLHNNTITTLGNGAHGIRISESSNSNITENKLNTTNGYAIFIQTTTIDSYYNHTIDTTNTEQGKPIYYYFNNDSLLIENLDNIGELYMAVSNNITVRNLTLDRDGIILAKTTNSTIENCDITNSNYWGVGIYLHSQSDTNTISNNTISTSNRYGHGIRIESSTNNSISNNNITTSGLEGYGIFLYTSFTNIVSNNIIFTSGKDGYGIELRSSDNSILSKNNITTTNQNGYGIFLFDLSDFNIISENTIKTISTSSAHGIYFYNSNSNEVNNTNITTSGGTSRDIYVTGTSNYTNYIINCTFNQSNIGFYSSTETDKIAVQWYLRANITDTSQNPISSATVTAYNISNISVASDLTNSQGLTDWFVLTEYTQNASQIYPTNVTYHTPHNITATKPGYSPNSTLVNLTETGSTTVSLMLETTGTGEISTCQELDTPNTIYYLTTDIINSSTSYCMNISANNVTLDCQGHTIDGDDVADYGIYISRSPTQTTNITLRNCIVSDWDSYGIYIHQAKNNTLENLSIVSNPDVAILLSTYSDYNKIINVTSYNNNFGLYTYSYISVLTIQNSTFKDNLAWDIFVDDSSSYNYQFENVIGTDNKPIVFFNTTVTLENWDNNASEIILANADYSVLRNITMERIGTQNNGILLVETDYCNITDIRASGLQEVVHLRRNSEHNRIENVTGNLSKAVIYLIYTSNYNDLNNITAISNTYGIYLESLSNNSLTNLTLDSNTYGIYLRFSSNNTIHSSTITQNTYGIYSDNIGNAYPNLIYNNLLNNTNNIYFAATIYNNSWNITKQPGTRIHSLGNYIGGNYYTNSTGNGFSDTCTDSDYDGFCDQAYDLITNQPCTPAVDCSNNTDYLPLSDEYTSFTITLNDPFDNAHTNDTTPDFTFTVSGTEPT